jgi:LPS sulfotransferase NodH
MQTRFVILCLGRSGSTHLQSLLDSHPDVRCFGELFSDRSPAGGPGFIHSSHQDPREFLEERLCGQGESAVGFKLPMNSIRAHPEAADLVQADRDFRVVRLSRSNHLAQFVSRRLQATTHVSHSLQGGYGEAKVAIEPRRVLNALERMEADEADLDARASGKPTFRITYEQLAEESDLQDLQRFLGVEPRPLRSWFERLRTRPLSEAVENWDELAAALRDTRFEPFVNEVGA